MRKKTRAKEGHFWSRTEKMGRKDGTSDKMQVG